MEGPPLDLLTPCPIIPTPRRWDDVLAATKKAPLSFLLSPYLGYGSAAALATAAGKSGAAQVRVRAVRWIRRFVMVSVRGTDVGRFPSPHVW